MFFNYLRFFACTERQLIRKELNDIWYFRQDTGLMFGNYAACYCLIICPLAGGTGPSFATTHTGATAMEDWFPLSRIARTVK